jgi:hypothetical protein
MLTALLTLGAIWILASIFIAGLCRMASRRRPTDVVIPAIARRHPTRKTSD